MDSSCCSNVNDDGNDDDDDSLLNQVKSRTTPSKAAVTLLEDYTLWLVSSDQLEQVLL